MTPRPTDDRPRRRAPFRLASRRSQALSFAMLLAVGALVAQVAGVGGTRTMSNEPAPVRLALVAGSAVPDVTSTTLHAVTLHADAGETLRLHSTAAVSTTGLSGNAVSQVVCGIRYSRDADPSWTVGVPYDTVTLTPRKDHATVTIDRSIAAPAADTYRAATVCHVSSEPAHSTASATGDLRIDRGLPAGAATPAPRAH